MKASSWSPWVLAGLAALGAFLLFRTWEPAPGSENTICPLRRFAGLPCPGCGMTRAFAHLAKGEWSAAASDHLLAYGVAAELALGWLIWGLALVRRRPFLLRWGIERLALVHLAVFVVFWLGRLATGTLPW